MGPYRGKQFKTLLLQIAAKSFQTSEFSFQWSSQKFVWDFWNFENWTFNEFLALADYVSRAHEIEMRPSSVRVAIILGPNAQISFKFRLLLPAGHTLGCFLNCWKKYFYEYISFSHETLWEQNIQNATPPTNRSREFPRFSWIFSPMVLTKLRLKFLKFGKLKFQRCSVFVFVNMDPMAVKISKRYSFFSKTSNSPL